MFHLQLPVLILLYLFFILNHSILCFSGNFPTPNSPYDNIANYDYPISIPLAPKQRKIVFGRVNTVATVVTILLALLNIVVYKLRKLQESSFYEQFNVPQGQLCRRFLLNDILLATNHFDDALVIGQGGFGKVYKGVIDNGTITVAIKRLNRTSRQGAPEFWTEVEMLSKFRHSHLVSLIGYCNNCNEMILVYEYMIQGTLADHLHKIGKNVNNNSSLSWVRRLKICIGAARGLDYLHTGTGIQQRVIHRDVKSSNILLDENWAAKISDFGLSKTGPADQSCTHISTNVKGTFGYLDPEYFLTRRLTRKSDVYAFGVVLFEVLCGRRAVDVRLEEEQWSLAGWAQLCVKEGRLGNIVDPSLKWEIFPNSLNAFAQIANQCLDYSSKKRPTMAEVVAALESALALQQKRNSSIIEMEIFDICSSHENQENAGSSTEQREVIGAGTDGVCEEEQIDGINVENLESRKGQQENSSNVVNEEKQIDKIMGLGDANIRSSPAKPARIVAFTKIVRQFFHGTAQVTSVHRTAKPPNNGKSSSKNGENGNGDVQQLPLNLQMETRHLKIFTYEELATATGNFGSRLLIGKGTFGRVFKVWVDKKTYKPSKDGVGMAVAVKKFDLRGFEEYITWQVNQLPYYPLASI
ncbi:hypothetical protein LguiA_030856 [Lonicera macranthoides]